MSAPRVVNKWRHVALKWHLTESVKIFNGI
jgi:hypothetical protein